MELHIHLGSGMMDDLGGLIEMIKKMMEEPEEEEEQTGGMLDPIEEILSKNKPKYEWETI